MEPRAPTNPAASLAGDPAGSDELHVGHETLRLFAGIDRTNRWLFETLEPYLGRRIVEAGSGIGNVTQFLLDRERVIAVDLDAAHIESLRERFGGDPKVRLLQVDIADRALVTETRDESCDTVLCCNVLEHIRDDAVTLKNFFDLLVPGGKLVLLVPAMPALFSPLDEALGHFRRYRRDDLAALVERAGFRIVTTRYLNLFGIPGWLLSGKVMRRRVLPTSLLWLFNLAVPLFRLVERLTGPPIGLSVIAIGEKPATDGG